MYSTSGKADFRIEVNGDGKMRSRDISDFDASSNGQLFYKLNVGDIVQVKAAQSFTLFGYSYYSYFQITFLYPD